MPKQIMTRTIAAYYMGAMRRYPSLLGKSFLQPLGTLSSSVGVPYFAGLALGSAASQDGNFSSHMMWLSVCIILAVFFNLVGFGALMVLQANVMKDLNIKIFQHILHRGTRFHNNQIGGKLVSDALDFVMSFANLNLSLFTSVTGLLSTVVIGLAVVFTQSIQLAFFLSVIILISVIAAYFDSKKRSSVRKIRHDKEKELIAHFSDTLVNAPTVKAFGSEHQEVQTSTKLNDVVLNLRRRDWVWAGRSGTFRIGILLTSVLGLLMLYNYLVQRDPSVIGIGIFAYTYTLTLILRLFEVNTLTRTMEEAILKAEPGAQILSDAFEVQDQQDAKKLSVTEGVIDFNAVNFAYGDSSSDAVFENLSLHIESGEKIGLVGASGGGKSTLTKLLLRFEDINDGSIAIDGQDIRFVKQDSLRQHIAYVPQEPLLFHRSVAENISYGKEHASQEEILQAAKMAHADEFITKLPQGYKTPVGERGVKLSGGQRQRVAIARAMLKDAPILVLDEATSALDSESEVLIQEALWELMKGRTTIVIAHRLSTIQKMDRILVLDEGQILEHGTHAQLIKKKNGQYARLWKHQSGGFLQDN